MTQANSTQSRPNQGSGPPSHTAEGLTLIVRSLYYLLNFCKKLVGFCLFFLYLGNTIYPCSDKYLSTQADKSNYRTNTTQAILKFKMYDITTIMSPQPPDIHIVITELVHRLYPSSWNLLPVSIQYYLYVSKAIPITHDINRYIHNIYITPSSNIIYNHNVSYLVRFSMSYPSRTLLHTAITIIYLSSY